MKRARPNGANYLAHQDHSHNLRFAVEATVRSVKHPFPAGKLPVRGQFRVTSRTVAIASAATTNVRTRSVQRYPMAKMKQAEATKSPQGEAVPAAMVSFFVFPMHWLRSRLAFSPSFSY
jgi:hypothetical protein